MSEQISISERTNGVVEQVTITIHHQDVLLTEQPATTPELHELADEPPVGAEEPVNGVIWRREPEGWHPANVVGAARYTWESVRMHLVSGL